MGPSVRLCACHSNSNHCSDAENPKRFFIPTEGKKNLVVAVV